MSKRYTHDLVVLEARPECQVVRRRLVRLGLCVFRHCALQAGRSPLSIDERPGRSIAVHPSSSGSCERPPVPDAVPVKRSPTSRACCLCLISVRHPVSCTAEARGSCDGPLNVRRRTLPKSAPPAELVTKHSPAPSVHISRQSLRCVSRPISVLCPAWPLCSVLTRGVVARKVRQRTPAGRSDTATDPRLSIRIARSRGMLSPVESHADGNSRSWLLPLPPDPARL